MNTNEQFNDWLKREKKSWMNFGEDMKEIKDGLEIKEKTIGTISLIWNKQLYANLINDFLDCDYLYTYTLIDFETSYFAEFKHKEDVFYASITEKGFKLKKDFIYNDLYEFDTLDDETLFDFYERFKKFVKNVLLLPKYRLKNLFNENEENLITSKFEKIVIERKEKNAKQL